MRNKPFALFMGLLLTISLSVTALAIDDPEISIGEGSAVMTTNRETGERIYPEIPDADVLVFVNDKCVCTGRLVFNETTPYVPVEAMSRALGAETSWDAASGACSVRAAGLELTAWEGTPYLLANGRYLYMDDGTELRDGVLLVPLETLCRAFGAQMTWDADTRTASVAPGDAPIASGDSFYDEDALYWLAHIIHAEAGNQPLEGMIAVGNVVMNRVRSDKFPNTIKGVLFQKNQFSPASSGSIYAKPNTGSWIAAKLVLDGADVAKNSLYFVANRVAGRWKRPVTMRIGGHTFFA